MARTTGWTSSRTISHDATTGSRVVGTGEDAADLAMGRRQGRDLLAFRRGLSGLPAPVDIFVKVDADTSFEPDYFARLLGRFAEQPDLGIAGGTCYELMDGEWQRIKVSGSHPRGASRAYRWALLDDVFALEPELGWDGVDEVMAELRGYRTAGFTDFGFRHHRKVGEREGRLRAGSALGTTGLVHGLPARAISCFELSTEPARTSPHSRWSGAMPGRQPAERRSARTRPSPSASVRVSVCAS